MESISKAWTIIGRVQGVGFRYFVREIARTFGIRGYAKNLPDGTVEVAAVGLAPALRALEGQLAEGPPMSSVLKIEEIPPPPSLEETNGFTVL